MSRQQDDNVLFTRGNPRPLRTMNSSHQERPRQGLQSANDSSKSPAGRTDQGGEEDLVAEGSRLVDEMPGTDLLELEDCVRLLEQLRIQKQFETEAGLPCDEEAWVGTSIGRFILQKQLGSGGGGIVYLAHDPVLRRLVALKIPRAEALFIRESRERFLREAEAAAALDHPNIVRVYDVGEHGPFCYIASAYCDGPNLANWLAACKQPVNCRDAAQLVAQLAAAVAHAHSRGILHRDIKPSNVLMDTPPAAAAAALPTPKLTDFGLAKLANTSEQMTRTGAVLGTPAYMAPEQAEGRIKDAGAHTDVWALGAVLYELLTGQAAFRCDSDAQTLQRVMMQQPTPVRRLRPNVPTDLAAICRKCLEKAPPQRYSTADELADDLQRFLCGSPTRARPLTRPQALWRWARRHPQEAALLSTVALALVLFVSILGVQNFRLRELTSQLEISVTKGDEARMAAETSRARAEQLLYASDMQLADRAWKDGDLRRVLELLKRHVPTAGEEDERGIEWFWLWKQLQANHQTLATSENAFNCLAFSPQGRWLAAAGSDEVVEVYDAETKTLDTRVRTGHQEVTGVAFSADDHLLSAGEDGVICLWQLPDCEEVLRIRAHDEPIRALAVAPELDLIVSASDDRTLGLWRLTNGKRVGQLVGHTGGVSAVAISPATGLAASCSHDRTVRLWDLPSQQVLNQLVGHEGRVTCLDFSADGQFLVTGGIDGTARLWEVASGKLWGSCQHIDGVQSAAFSPTHEWFVTGDRGGVVSMWPVSTPRSGSQDRALSADVDPSDPTAFDCGSGRRRGVHEGRIYGLAVSPTGSEIASVGADGQIGLWHPGAAPHRWLFSHDVEADNAFPENDRILFTRGSTVSSIDPVSRSKRKTLWQAPDVGDGGQLKRKNQARKLRAARQFCGDLIVCDRDSLWVLNRDHRLLTTIPRYATMARVSQDGMTCAIWDTNREMIWLHAIPDGRQVASTPSKNTWAMTPMPGRCLAFNRENDIIIFDVSNLKEQKQLRGHTNTVLSMALSPDATLLASVGDDRRLILWDLPTGLPVWKSIGHRDVIRSVVFAADQRTLITAGYDGRLIAWQSASGQKLVELIQFPGERIKSIELSENGRWLVVCTNEGRIEVLDFAKLVVPNVADEL